MYNFISNKNDWCWLLADGRVWSTQQNNFVDNAFVNDWLLRSGFEAVPESPKDESGEHSEQGLREALEFYNLPIGALATLDDLRKQFTQAIQRRLDEFAQTRGYESIFSATTYATSNNPQFGSEGRYAVEARDATWATAYSILNDVLSGKRTLPSLQEFFTELPELKWPEIEGYEDWALRDKS